MEHSIDVGASRQCVVGYALNAKKLRKSSHDPLEPTSPDRPKGKREGAAPEWRGGGLADILVASPFDKDETGVCFVPWEYDVPLAEQPVLDIIIHKLTEDIDNSSKESIAKLLALDTYLSAYPDVVVVDPMDCVRRVVSRARTCAHLQSIVRSGDGTSPFTQPKYVVLDKFTSVGDTLQELEDHEIRLPVICKPVLACGSPHSHSMIVITSREDLSLLQVPCVVQQYHDHGGVLFKVYVIDGDVMVFRRRSLPDLHCAPTSASVLASDLAGSSQEGTRRASNGVNGWHSSGRSPVRLCAKGRCSRLRSVAFDSRRSYPSYAAFVCDDCAAATSSSSKESEDGTADGALASSAEPIPAGLLEQLRSSAAAIRVEFGLTLFGFDVIIPSEPLPQLEDHGGSDNGCGRKSEQQAAVTVIDVNYFPSYKEVPDFPSRLRRYLASRKRQRGGCDGELEGGTGCRATEGAAEAQDDSEARSGTGAAAATAAEVRSNTFTVAGLVPGAQAEAVAV